MATLIDLKNLIEAQYPGRIYTMLSVEGNAVDDIQYTSITTKDDLVGIEALISSFDWDAKEPDVPGFFVALGKSIASGQLPVEIYGMSKMIQDQPSLTDQQAMMLGFAQNPTYSNEQKKLLDALVKQFHLQLPSVSK